MTASGLKELATAMPEWRAAYNAAQQIEDAGERRRAAVAASREIRAVSERTEFGLIPEATFSLR